MPDYFRKFLLNISQKNRRRKHETFLKIIAPNDGTKILDVGIGDTEYTPYDNFLEKNYKYLNNITGLSIEPIRFFKQQYPEVDVVVYDGQNFPFRNKAFDVIWSNAVLEHVGNRSKQANFLREIKRCGKKAFITTPNRYFPIEVHTRIPLVHWLPKKHFDRFLSRIGQDWAARDYMNLLNYYELQSLLLKAEIAHASIIGNYWGPFIMDFMVIF
jgi:SAM-dependent methyltransferase